MQDKTFQTNMTSMKVDKNISRPHYYYKTTKKSANTKKKRSFLVYYIAHYREAHQSQLSTLCLGSEYIVIVPFVLYKWRH